MMLWQRWIRSPTNLRRTKNKEAANIAIRGRMRWVPRIRHRGHIQVNELSTDPLRRDRLTDIRESRIGHEE